MNTFGRHLPVTIFGASHEANIGLVIDHYPAGIPVDRKLIEKRLLLRRGISALTSKRHEDDQFQILSGVYQGFTTGAPITVLIANHDVKSADYEKLQGIARPSHADYTRHLRYHGYQDPRGGGTASGRMTVALIVLGAFSEMLLAKKGILCAGRILSVGQVSDSPWDCDDQMLERFGNESFPVYHEDIKAKMTEAIIKASQSGDSLGGITETYISHVPAGLGEPFFDSAESLISHLAFSVPGVKGIEFGDGFRLATETGSRANDAMRYENGTLRYVSNHSGGINGGITNGNVIVFRTAFKPTPSISLPQETVNYETKSNVTLSIAGRHDAIIAIKGLHVMTAIAQYAISEMMLEYGYE